jgi:tripartite-type tricarboxylate transporter receptor subunit TctC
MKPHRPIIALVMIVFTAISLLSLGCTASNSASSYPGKTPVTVIVPWPAGGRTDVATRVFAPYLEKQLGVPVVVTNKEGGGSVVGARAVGSSQPDGHTVGIFSVSVLLAQYTKTPPVDMSTFTPVCQMFSTSSGLFVRPDAPWATLDEYVKYGRANPEKIKHGIGGTGTVEHIMSSAMLKEAGVKVTVVPYAGDAPTVAALLSGEVDSVYCALGSAKPQVDAKKVKVLGTSSQQRHPLFPDVPTFKEGGVDFTANSFEGIFAPKGTPPAVIERLSKDLEKALKEEKVLEHLKSVFVDPDYLNTKDYAAKIGTWNPKFEALTEELGLRVSQ